MKKTAFIITALSALTLSGCGHISKNFVSEDTLIDKAEFATGIDASRLSVVKGSVKPELDSIHYQVKTKGGATYRCYFTSAIAITSDAVAPPLFTIKPACFSDTHAPPIAYPFRPHSSISAPAK